MSMSYASKNDRVSSIWKSSEHYLWNVEDILGRGATAVVHKAVRKDNGEGCAVKVFHDRVSFHHSSVPRRELDIVTSLNHKNVIRIFGIDVDSAGNHVLGMEYCRAGSVYTQLDKPENAFGFPEEEFQRVLHDIAHGMHYLKRNGIIHRDIKPGNIMKFIDEDGSSIYKLTDFGAAKKVDEEEEFTSIYGTEEYLDPDMYNQAVLRRQFKDHGQTFTGNVDIWSLGVTLYHVATGRLPFMPHGGRSNSHTMHRITKEKEQGVISGIQRTADGPIEYSRQLPKTCVLSPCLKNLIVPVLAGLMESTLSVRWSFDRFFDAVNNILNMKVIKMFECNSGCNLRIYVGKSDRYASFQEVLARETDIPAVEQLILYDNRELSEIVVQTMEIQEYPKRILTGQLFLYSRERVDRQKLALPEIPSFPTMPEHMAIDKDSHYLHKICAIACLISKSISNIIQQQELMEQAETHLRDFIFQIIKRINSCVPDMSEHLMENDMHQKTFFASYSCLNELVQVIEQNHSQGTTLKRAKVKLRQILNDESPKEVLQKAMNRCNEVKVYMEVLVEKMNEHERDAMFSYARCSEDDHCVQKSSYLVTLLTEIWTMFTKHRKQRTLLTEEEFIHNTQKLKSQEYSARLLSILEGHCRINVIQTYDVTTKQISLLLKNLQRTKKVDQNIRSVKDCRVKLSERIGKMEIECKKIADEAIEMTQWCLRTTAQGATAMPLLPYETLSTATPFSSFSMERVSLRMCYLHGTRM
ncbi:serine/threonine-protein kinase TBK1-like isoform X2 [Mizuhopecten yessoensis]|uniref:Serine/threonine-protein kinase TBK1 n=1 Tax=Mizuhopecten yessoensis TaxID=6573 RepID=A0A210PF59_MIZYE|nr:serine/threonine-protein kinase TBK1-like isoform X2 [Mizuhopecten yessoensis]OWF35119.1 Serine/threonine-protein kinase TBK1 [Mizuhopecten yessoensis]